jgi:hypothetical protein
LAEDTLTVRVDIIPEMGDIKPTIKPVTHSATNAMSKEYSIRS